jgi:hypothetical protein
VPWPAAEPAGPARIGEIAFASTASATVVPKIDEIW